jgi:hypothetical protein
MRGAHHHHRRGFGPRRPFPNREEWLEHLQARQQRLEQDLANVKELIERLADGPARPEPAQAEI